MQALGKALTTQQDNAIFMSEVAYRYPKSTEDSLNIVNWSVKRGEQVFIYGHSGTGKSTLLNLLAGILTTKQGSITILGQALSELSARQRDSFRARHIGMVFQQFNLVPHLSVMDNIQLAAYFAGTNARLVQQRYPALFEGLSLELNLINRRADSLSIGQQQRVAIARALINHPQLLIVDEPTSALDNESKSGFITMLMSLVKKEQITLIFVSHDETLAPRFSQQISMADLSISGARHVA
jgi:putative ABC transport system ATP-binding protein